MQYLILLLLIFSSCIDNKKEPETQVSLEEIVINTNSQLITKAGYGIDPELFWLEEYASNNSVDIEYLYTYSFIYYEPISNQYYFATIEKTNNIFYDTNNIIDEKNHIDYKGLSKMPITYIGSIDLTNRIYIDSSNNQYVKSLELIDDTVYFDYKDQKQVLSSPVYPYARHYDGDGGDIYQAVFYSNNMDFNRTQSFPYKEDFYPYDEYKPPFPPATLIRVGFL